MRVAIIADSHFDQNSRFEECVRIHDWIADECDRQRVDLILHAGDVYERRSTPLEREAVASWVQRLAYGAPVVIVRGNHDAIGDLALLERLDTGHPVIVEEMAGVRYVDTGAGEVAIGCVAWPRKAHMMAQLQATGYEGSELAAADAMRAILGSIGSEMLEFESGPRVLLSHAMVRGSQTSHGQPLVGCDLEVSLEDLALAGADLVALGHIHMPQEWDTGTTPVIYPGSPRRTAFGEVEQKGFVIADIEGSGEEARVEWERVATPCTQMRLLTGRMVDTESPETGADMRVLEVSENPAAIDLDGAEVRLRYTVAPDERESARRDAEGWRDGWISRGAASVKLEEVVTSTTRARAPEVAAATTLDAKLRAYWAARDTTPDEERAAVLLSNAHVLEDEVRNAI